MRKVEERTRQGMSIPEAATNREIEGYELRTLRTRRAAAGNDRVVERLEFLERENARLNRIIAKQALDISALKNLKAEER